MRTDRRSLVQAFHVGRVQMNEVQQIILGVFIGLIAIFDFYTIARFKVNERLMKQMVKKMIEKVEHYDTIVKLLDCRIAAMGDRIDRMEKRGREE